MFSQRAPDTHIGGSKSASISQQSFDPESPAKKESKFNLSTKLGTRLKWNGSWLWEIGASLISVICLALLVAFLVKINDASYASWQYTVSPNTVVSIITTITKASFLVSVSACLSQLKWNQYQGPGAKPLYSMQTIDQASRGPWGALEVFIALLSGVRLDILTTIGAFITILALAVDPFAQQILAFPQRTVLALNETASVQATHKYNYTDGRANSFALPTPLLSSVMVGLAQETQPLAAQCSTPRCDFPGFVSLGVCTRCKDITKDTQQVCGSMPYPHGNTFSLEIHAWCNYTLPNGQKEIGTVQHETSPPSDHNTSILLSSFNIMPQSTGTAYESPLLSIISMGVNTIAYWDRENMTAPAPSPSFHNCTMYLCEQEFSASRYIATDPSTHYPKISRTKEVLTQAASGIIDRVEIYPADGTSFLSKEPYQIDSTSLTTLKEQVYEIFNISLSQNGLRFSGFDYTPLFQSRGIVPITESVSTSLSNTLRSSSNQLATKIQGKAYRSESYIRVRWPWIILPICTTLGSILLLLGTSIMSHSQNSVLWKDSVIPLMMSQLQTLPDHRISIMKNVKEVNGLAKNINVYMAPAEGPLMFIEKPGSPQP